MSLDKAVEQLRFFWERNLSKSQADALLSRLAREWHVEFDRLCPGIAVSAVVPTDETSWSIGSVWTFLSEPSRLMIFGCRQDAATLEILLPKATFGGVLVSDDAAVYRGFTQAQKCGADQPSVGARCGRRSSGRCCNRRTPGLARCATACWRSIPDDS